MSRARRLSGVSHPQVLSPSSLLSVLQQQSETLVSRLDPSTDNRNCREGKGEVTSDDKSVRHISAGCFTRTNDLHNLIANI
jgi:hypothetical protein